MMSRASPPPSRRTRLPRVSYRSRPFGRRPCTIARSAALQTARVHVELAVIEMDAVQINILDAEPVHHFRARPARLREVLLAVPERATGRLSAIQLHTSMLWMAFSTIRSPD